jgi:hypothetical protein
LVRMLTLNEMSDDYENLAVSLEMPLLQMGREAGFAIERSDIVEALKELVELGWAKAWHLTSAAAEEFDHLPSLEEMEDFYGAWFHITDAGRKAQNEYDAWPFDDEGEIRKDWTPPEN